MKSLFLASICAFAIASSANAQPIDLSRYTMVDLTHELGVATTAWPGSTTKFRLDTVRATATGAMFNLFTPEHFGTHLDAPRHAAGTGWTNEAIPLARLIAPAVVIDVVDSAAASRDYALTVADIDTHEARHGRIPVGSIVLLRTGWAKYWTDSTRYFGRDPAGKLHFPSYGLDAARFLVEQRRVAAMGVDSPSTDIGAANGFPVHGLLGPAQVSGLENLADLSALPPTGASVFALPIKTVGGSGGPVRVVALVPR